MIRKYLFATLLFGAFLLNLFFFVFGNSAIFPPGPFDAYFFFVLVFFFALYRPGWAFLLFLSLLPFETIRLTPESIGISIRPYQLFGMAILVAIPLRFFFKKLFFSLIRLRWFDVLPVFFLIGSVFALVNAPNLVISGKQFAVVFSFVLLYFLSRQFLNNTGDIRRVFPFMVISGAGSVFFALWQNFLFVSGSTSFETMPGRPNAFFFEPDWLGMFLVFFGSIVLSFLYFLFETACRNDEEKSNAKNAELTCWDGDIVKNQELSFKGQVIQWCLRTFDTSRCLPFFVASFFLLSGIFLALLLTVARSAWVGFTVSSLLFLLLCLLGGGFRIVREWRWKFFLKGCGTVFFSFAVAFFVAWVFRLTMFEFGNRAGSAVSGFQKITVSCDAPVLLPEKIRDMEELFSYGCRHIRLEDIDAEVASGKSIEEVFRPDPSIEARRSIYARSIGVIRNNLVLGIGWGSIGGILGKDENGSALNASNIFLEVWLGSGILGFLSFVALWFSFPIFALRNLFFSCDESENKNLEVERAVFVFYLVSWVGFTVFNMFNSGIFLGFFWVWLGGIGLLFRNATDNK